MSEQEFDKVFKEAADNFSTKSDAGDWSKMNSRLDAEQNAAGVRQRYAIAISSLLILLTGAVLWFGYDSGVTSDKPHLSNSKPLSNTKKIDAKESVQKDELPATNVPQAPYNSTSKKNLSSQKGNKKIVGELQLLEEQENQKKFDEQQLEDQGEQFVKSDEEVTPAEDQPQSLKGTVTEEHQARNQNIINDSLSAVVSLKEDSILNVEAETQEDKKRNNNDLSRWNLKIGVSPDFSSIDFFEPGKAGLNYGVLLGYSFSPRWTIYTGVISSRKIYSSTRVNEVYTSSQGYDYDVSKLDGDCRVLDIPLSVYYNFRSAGSFSFSAGAGVSSYLMLSEQYDYHVSGNYGYNTYQQTIKGRNNEWFKVVNVSVLVSKQIGDRFFLELEPYVKMPVAGVGEGKVNLVSLGSFVYLRYNFPTVKSN